MKLIELNLYGPMDPMRTQLQGHQKHARYNVI